MKYILPFVAIIVFSCSDHSVENKNDSETKNEAVSMRISDSTEVTTMVHDFFQAFDERDIEKMESILTPATKIIHTNGVTTNTREMMDIIKGTKNWYPRKRNLSRIEFEGDENFAIVGLLNEVTFSLTGNKEVYEPYNETWIFSKTGNKWHPVRIHYSKIVQEKHSEEVE